MKKNRIPKLTVIGAGPGDPDLITLKAFKTLASANVVLYDALVNEELLKHAPDAIKIFVGKRFGKHYCKQNHINELIVKNALEYGHVVRLKGGDPFIFGRGSEEIQYADSFGIETQIISGISSSSAVPASIGIPLTHRRVAESFWVITGTTQNHKLSKDVYLAAESTATVVILMGMNKINQIVSIFENAGKKDTPVAIIQNGTRKDEKVGIGTVETIIDEVHAKQLSSPAIIIIGDVVKESVQLKSFYQNFTEVHKENIKPHPTIIKKTQYPTY
ncbi:uroporphyrinogen-III C-methyltransferase [Flavobacteriaceae bacterium UJ101]|nr:uroporphyrinogen-III C-methyltransferase [Flavobacteriaceae bacterium UJ101]